MFKSVLVVCVGNICRSPTGEYLLRELLTGSNIIVSSAGIGALVGKEADSSAKLTAVKHGLDLNGHVARQLTSSLCREHDLILVMEREHIDAVTNIAPEVRGKTMLFGHWLNQQDIPDPYRKSDEAFEFVFNLIKDSAQKWAKALVV